jgi:O-antigen/teichoic acid export membrane protein
VSRQGRVGALVGQSFTYGAGGIIARLAGFFLVPIYLAAAGTEAFGTSELMVSAVGVAAIMLRFGIVASMSRFTLGEGTQGDWAPVIHTVFAFVFVASTAGVLAGVLLLDQIAALLDVSRNVAAAGLLGVWVTMNYDVVARIYRIERRARAWVAAMLVNVALSAALTVYLVVVRDEGAAGLLVGNFAATGVVYAGLVVARRRTVGVRGFDPPLLRELLVFSLPLMPANLALWALNLADRIQLQRLAGPVELGQYAAAAKVAIALTVIIGAFQTAWAPFAHAVRGEEGDDVARQTYADIFTYWAMLAGWGVAVVTLLSAPYVALAFPAEARDAIQVVPLLAVGIVLYGAYLIVNVAVSISKRTRMTPLIAGVAGGTNVGLNFWFIPRWGIVGAGITTVIGYSLLVVLQWLNARRSFPVPYEWGRVGRIVALTAGVVAASLWALPESGALAILARVALAVGFPAGLVAIGVLSRDDVRRIMALRAWRRRRRREPAVDEAEPASP